MTSTSLFTEELTFDELIQRDWKKRLKTNQTSLKHLAHFYKEKVCNRSYFFKTSKGDFNILFYPDNFCHLLGIHHIGNKLADIASNPSIASEYKGLTGWDNIMADTMTFRTLKDAHGKIYESLRDRMLYFPIVFQILRSPEIVKYNQLLVKNKSLIKADFILFDRRDHKRRKAQMNLAIREENGIQVAVSFQVTFEPNDEKYTKRQKVAKVLEIEIYNLIDPNDPPFIYISEPIITIESN